MSDFIVEYKRVHSVLLHRNQHQNIKTTNKNDIVQGPNV